MTCGDHLEHGGHADHVCSPRSSSTYFRGCLEVWPVQAEVHGLGDVGGHTLGHFAQFARVRVCQVDEASRVWSGRVVAGQRRVSGEIDVVANEHCRAHLPLRAQAPRTVGEDHGGAAGGVRRAHTVHDGMHTATLVEVRTPSEEQHSCGADRDGDELTAVSECGGLGEPWNFVHGK